jgi:chorismate synthase
MKVELTYEEIRFLANSIQILPQGKGNWLTPTSLHWNLAHKMKAIEAAAAVEHGKQFISGDSE